MEIYIKIYVYINLLLQNVPFVFVNQHHRSSSLFVLSFALLVSVVFLGNERIWILNCWALVQEKVQKLMNGNPFSCQWETNYTFPFSFCFPSSLYNIINQIYTQRYMQTLLYSMSFKDFMVCIYETIYIYI